LATGVAPGVDLVALRAFNDVGEGSFDWIESALQWVHLHRDDFQFPVTTVNLSLGSAWNLDAPPPSATLEEELSQLETDGIFVAAAAGNEFPTYQTPGLDYPAASPHVVSVMSFDDSGQLSYFSQRQGRAIAAPGRQIVSTVPDYAGNNNGLVDDYMAQSGTNMAAPFLAGASVLIREAMEIVGYTDITQQTIYDDMIGTADLIYDPATEQDYYRINIASAIDALLPEDDFGSTTETAYDMGVVAVPTEITGLISGSNDMDFMTFVAARTGTAFLTTSSSDYLEPDWIVADDESQVLVEGGGDDIVFPVTAGRAYTLGLSSLDGIGHFESTVSIDSMLLGDFNLDGSVSAADYTIWRNTNGSSDDLRADADRSGIVDEADYVLWKQSFSDQPMSLAAPEPSSYMLWIAVLFSTVPIRHRWS